MKICACGCGQRSKPYYWRGGIKSYCKYADGHAPKQIPTAASLNALWKGRETSWKNPEYIAKMKRISSKTMLKTNTRRAAGEFPEWDANNKAAVSKRSLEQWRSGEMRKRMAIRADGFRSGLERHFADYLTANKVPWEYEPKSFPLLIDGVERTYTPDFYLPSLDWWVETKGFFWDADAKQRVELFAKQYSELKFSVLDRKLKNLLGVQWEELSGEWTPYNTNNHIHSPLLNSGGEEITVKRISHQLTHCKRGHEFKEGSFKVLPGNRRDCIECCRIRYREGRAALKAA
jgi:hypothetical protein